MPKKLLTPPVADLNIQELLAMRRSLATVATAQHIDFFDTVGSAPFTIDSVAKQFSMSLRASEAMIAVLNSLQLSIPQDDGFFVLSDESKTYLIKDSPFYRMNLLSDDDPVFGQHRDAFAADDKPVDPFAVDLENLDSEVIENFMKRMHMLTLPTASALGQISAFGRIKKLLDVGGGSGSLSIGVATHNPNITITILDLKPVCKIAKRNIEEYGFSERIGTLPGSMFEPLPKGYDGILFGNIFHDWDITTCTKLAQSAFEALEPGGTICLQEMILWPKKDGPLAVAAFSVGMLVHELGKQFTQEELEALLGDAGFINVQVAPSFGHYSLVTAQKPA